jgi:hypothetical protein
MEIACAPLPRFPTNEQHLSMITSFNLTFILLGYQADRRSVSSEAFNDERRFLKKKFILTHRPVP